MSQGVRLQTIGTATVLPHPFYPAENYRVEATDDLVNGTSTPLVDAVPGTGSIVTITDAGRANIPPRFYRVIVSRWSDVVERLVPSRSFDK
jgi:hypothetical protein